MVDDKMYSRSNVQTAWTGITGGSVQRGVTVTTRQRSVTRCGDTVLTLTAAVDTPETDASKVWMVLFVFVFVFLRDTHRLCDMATETEIPGKLGGKGR